MNATAPLTTPAVAVDIEDVNLSYGANHVLKGINLAIEPGEFFAFLGPSGCGKTTLLRLIAGFNQADTGQVRIGGKAITGLPPWKRDVGMVFQSYALWPHMTVRRNVAFGLEERGIKRTEIDRRVEAALGLVGLAHLAERRPSQLSGGQQQRVAVARTVAVEPKVLLLDEPLSNLDAKMRVQVRRELRDMQQRLGLTTIFVTHDQEEANTICDRIAVMNDGIVQQVGTPMELYERPANLFVANFLGTANILDGRVVEAGAGRQFVLDGGIGIPIGDAHVPIGAKLVFRPQHARLSLHGLQDSGVSLPSVVNAREFLGSTVRYFVCVNETEVAVDMPFRSGRELFETDAKVVLSLPQDSLLWLAD
ncbi:ABC transporter ATP-binding protein [Bosea sp. NBC_00550]|uniref:ABC transporter ATP-binding protein n=1 Tax=Bosea sp. NBC_00550 TaxID=2969621 RepID=UPI00222F98ED|nr:ABC transporter ATP-binding protein [Bosea sp. NBC_00550]UZF91108.1 ABC transporter ATP-binding protein [Bosea sp. NBC_00550]